MKNLYRRYKISQITNDGITSDEKEIVEFILDKINDLTLYIDEYGCHNYMNNKGGFIFEQDDENDILWLRYQDFWEVLVDKYSLNKDDIEFIIKGMVETAYKMCVGTPTYTVGSYAAEVETAYKMCVGTPRNTNIVYKNTIETAYKKYKKLLNKNI